MKAAMKKVISLFLVLTMVISFSSVSTYAATKKLKNQTFTTDTAVANRKALSVKKGTYTVKLPSKGKGYLKFKAPKKATYSFTLSKLKASSSYSCGYFYVMRKYGTTNQYIGQEKLKQKGGKQEAMNIATRNSTSGKVISRYLTSRTGKITLRKGEVVYLYFSFWSEDKSVVLKIK